MDELYNFGYLVTFTMLKMADIRHTALQPMSDFNDNPRHSILNFIHPGLSSILYFLH